VRADFKQIRVDSRFVNGKSSSASPGKDVIADVEDAKEKAEGELLGGKVVGIEANSSLQQDSFEKSCCSGPLLKVPFPVHTKLAHVRSQCFLMNIGMSENARKRCVFIRALKIRNQTGSHVSRSPALTCST
jgi:hypothetical protein